MALGALWEISVPSVELSSRSKLMIPRPSVTGTISLKTRVTRGSRQSKASSSLKPSRASTGSAIPSWTIVPARMPIAYA